MGAPKSTTKVPPLKEVRNSRGTRVDGEVVQGGVTRQSGHAAVDSDKFSVRPSTQVIGVHYVTRKLHLGKVEALEDLVVAPKRQRQGERVARSQTPNTYPRRLCQWYMRTAECKFGDKCIYYHPPDVQAPNYNSEGYPLRENKENCPHYLKHGVCDFGYACKFNHPERNIGDGSTYSATDAPNLSTNATSGYAPYPVPGPMPSQGCFPPMTTPLQMTQYPYMSQRPFLIAPINAALMPCFYAYPQMSRFGYMPTQEGHLVPSLPTVFGSGSSFVADSYKAEQEQSKESFKEDDQSEYDEN